MKKILALSACLLALGAVSAFAATSLSTSEDALVTVSAPAFSATGDLDLLSTSLTADPFRTLAVPRDFQCETSGDVTICVCGGGGSCTNIGGGTWFCGC